MKQNGYKVHNGKLDYVVHLVCFKSKFNIILCKKIYVVTQLLMPSPYGDKQNKINVLLSSNCPNIVPCFF
jgi:hypothetical protein